MTKKEVSTILIRASSHEVYLHGLKLGVTKFQAFLSIKPVLKGKMYWYALRNSYCYSDNLFEYRVKVKEAFLSEEPDRKFLMNKAERDYLSQLPNEITIYRGMTKKEWEGGKLGCSWTLKRKKAEFFAHEYKRNLSTLNLETIVHELKISKHDVIAFFKERNEFEIIYFRNKNVFG